MMKLASDSAIPSASPVRAWLVPAALLAHAAVPVLVGVFRLVGLTRPATGEEARLAASPLALALHIMGFTGFAILGALQFSAPLQRRRWHRKSGRFAVVLGLVGALAGMWIAAMVPPGTNDAPWLPEVRFAAGVVTVFCLLAGFRSGRADPKAHRAWMTRGYAIALGGGTQVFTVLPYAMTVEHRSASVYSLLLASGWIINLAVAEWVIRRRGPRLTPALAVAMLLFLPHPAHAEDQARGHALVETAAEVARDTRIKDGAGAVSAGVLLAGAGIASWVSPAQPDDRSTRDVIGGVLVGVGGTLLAGGTYALFAPSDLERHREAYEAALRAGDKDATEAILREAERTVTARAKAARRERIAGTVAAFVFGALEVGGGLLLQARADDEGLVWLGRGLVAGGAGTGILGVASLIVRSEEERLLDIWQRDRSLAAPSGRTSTPLRIAPRLGPGQLGVGGTF